MEESSYQQYFSIGGSSFQTSIQCERDNTDLIVYQFEGFHTRGFIYSKKKDIRLNDGEYDKTSKFTFTIKVDNEAINAAF